MELLGRWFGSLLSFDSSPCIPSTSMTVCRYVPFFAFIFLLRPKITITILLEFMAVNSKINTMDQGQTDHITILANPNRNQWPLTQSPVMYGQRSVVWKASMETTIPTTGALPVNKRETTAMVIITRSPQVSHTAFSYSMCSRWTCHWLSPTICFTVIGWQVRLIIGQSAILRLRLWEWSVAKPSELFDRQVRYLDIYLFYVHGTDLQCFDAVGWAAGRAFGL